MSSTAPCSPRPRYGCWSSLITTCRYTCACACAVLVLTATPLECAAQGGATVIREAEYALANIVFAGVAAGMLREIRGGSFVDGFVPGAAGGAVHYAGKRLLPASATWSDIVGHQVAGVGSSLIAHAATADTSGITVMLPIGPLYVTISREDGFGYLIDVRDAVTILYAVIHPDLTFMSRESLTRGVPIFRARNRYLHERDLTGVTNGGVVFIEPIGNFDTDGLLVHEITHVLQHHLLNEVLFHPAERALLRRLPGGRRIEQLPIRLSALYWGFNRFLGAVSLKDQVLLPLEREAAFLESQIKIHSFVPQQR
jgi:hypothetical protein